MQFETNVQMLKQRKGPWQTSLEAVAKGIEQSMGRQFNEDRFRELLAVAPDFYLHRWDVKQGKSTLLVHIPKNINQILHALQTGDEKEME